MSWKIMLQCLVFNEMSVPYCNALFSNEMFAQYCRIVKVQYLFSTAYPMDPTFAVLKFYL